jgi:hypothetical protein
MRFAKSSSDSVAGRAAGFAGDASCGAIGIGD